MKKIKQIIVTLVMILATFNIGNIAHAGAILTVTLADEQSSKIVWQCADITECVERIITRVEEHGACDKRVQKIEIVTRFIPGFDDEKDKPSADEG